MHLIAPLAAGINGAANGTAFVYRRGTSTKVSYYSDFEATAATTQPSTGIVLDSNGGAIVYVDMMVNVVVKDSNGATVRTFVAGVKDSSTEVISTGFTGTDYVTGASAVSKPTNLQSVLDKWFTSSGSTDFKVLIGGVATNLDDAVQGLSGVFFNVKAAAYGATGDGATDDYAACAAAITAAAVSGGIVVFPPGTYRLTQMLTVPYNVSVMGCGAENTHIKLDAATASTYSAFYFSGTASAHYHYQTLVDLRISCNQPNTVEAIRVKDAHVAIERVEFIGSNDGFEDALIETNGSPTGYHIILRDCFFGTVTDSTGIAIVCASASTSGRLEMYNCTFKHAGTSFTAGPMVDMSGTTSQLRAVSCFFDVSSATSTNSGSILRSSGDLIANGCHFKAPANGTSYLFVFANIDATAGVASESGTVLEGAGAKLIDSSSSLTGLLDQIKMHSRPAYYSEVSTTAASASVDALIYGSYLIQKTSGATLTVNLAAVPPLGSRLILSIWNNGTGGNVAVTWGTSFKGTNLNVADNMVNTFEFVSRAGPAGTIYMYQVGTPRDETE